MIVYRARHLKKIDLLTPLATLIEAANAPLFDDKQLALKRIRAEAEAIIGKDFLGRSDYKVIDVPNSGAEAGITLPNERYVTVGVVDMVTIDSCQPSLPMPPKVWVVEKLAYYHSLRPFVVSLKRDKAYRSFSLAVYAVLDSVVARLGPNWSDHWRASWTTDDNDERRLILTERGGDHRIATFGRLIEVEVSGCTTEAVAEPAIEPPKDEPVTRRWVENIVNDIFDNRVLTESDIENIARDIAQDTLGDRMISEDRIRQLARLEVASIFDRASRSL